MDTFSRRIRGWYPGAWSGPRADDSGFKKGFKRGCPEVHHCDRWVQYAAIVYFEILTTHEVKISMAPVGEPEENGYAKGLMRTIKEEEVDLSEYEDFGDVLKGVGRFLDEIYNRKRIHSSLGYLTPAEFEGEWKQKPLTNACLHVASRALFSCPALGAHFTL
jgi:putative transposase